MQSRFSSRFLKKNNSKASSILLKNLTTTVESLADGYAKVKLTGTIHAQTNSADFGRILRNATHGLFLQVRRSE